MNPAAIPLALYLHLPWCVRKCPYCDFNSFTTTKPPPRARYIDALKRAGRHLAAGRREMVATGSGELLAEELRLAQAALGEITGEMLPDDLLGEIFSSFCIGK